MPNSSLRPTDMKSTVSSNDFQTGNTFQRILSLIFFELFGVQRKTAKTPFLASNALKSKNAFNSAVLFLLVFYQDSSCLHWIFNLHSC